MRLKKKLFCNSNFVNPVQFLFFCAKKWIKNTMILWLAQNKESAEARKKATLLDSEVVSSILFITMGPIHFWSLISIILFQVTSFLLSYLALFLSPDIWKRVQNFDDRLTKYSQVSQGEPSLSKYRRSKCLFLC